MNCYYPFLDHVIKRMNDRFPQGLKGALQGTLLIPANVGKLTPKIEDGLKKEFAAEFPKPQTFEQEVSLWYLIGVNNVIIFFRCQPKCSLKTCMVMAWLWLWL